MFRLNERGITPILILVAVLGIILFLAISNIAPFKSGWLDSLYQKDESQAATGDLSGTTFVETFTGFPTAPQDWNQTGWHQRWDVAIHSRGIDTWDSLQPMLAHHGADCSVPVNSTNPGNPVLVTHQVGGSYPGSVFNCRDHAMTAINADEYGLIVLTPNHLVDFSKGEATIKFDMSTYRASTRDWVDFWISPYAENLQLPLCCAFPDLQGNPRRGVVFKLEGSEGVIVSQVVRNFAVQDLQADWQGLSSLVPASAARRDTFEIKISKTKVKMCLLTINYNAANPGPQGQTSPVNLNHCFVDQSITDLGWDKGVFQIGHHSYTPDKDCGTPNPPISCSYNTWHWDNVSMSPAEPFTIIKANKRIVKKDDADKTVTFNTPAPANSHLRFSAIGRVEYSLNNGSSWQVAPKQPAVHAYSNAQNQSPEHFASYFVSIPEGSQNVTFRFSADSWYDTGFNMAAKDFSIWSLTPPTQTSPTPTTSNLPSTAPSATQTPTPTPTPLPSPSPSRTSTPTPTPTPTPIVGGSIVKIYAAGTPAEDIFPRMRLDIFNTGTKSWQAVKTWTNVQGNPSNRQFQEYIYNSTTKLSGQNIRVRFNNDRYNPILGQDRNLVVDRINLDGVDIQTERDTTYSQGSWDPSAGCKAGIKKSEWLHCNGYFEFR